MQRGERSCAKRARLLSLNQKREIVMDSDSDEAQYNASGTKWRNGATPNVAKIFPFTACVQLRRFRELCGRGCWECGKSTATIHAVDTALLLPNACTAPVYRAPKREKQWGSTSLQSTPPSVLMLCLAEITLLVVETNRYHDCLDSTDEHQHPQRDVTEAEMFVFMALTLQMGHTIQGRLEDYWTKSDQLCCPFYRQWHVIDFTTYYGFCISRTITGRFSHGRLWKITDLFEILRTNFAKFNNPPEHLVEDEIIVKFKGRVIFIHPLKRQTFRHQNVQTQNVQNWLQRLHTTWTCIWVRTQTAAQHLTATHVTVTNLTRVWVGH